MGIKIINKASNPNDEIDYEIYDEHIQNGIHVRKITGSLTIPARGSIGQFHWLYLGASSDGSSPALTAQNPSTPPARDVFRPIGAIGTLASGTELMRQMQDDRRVTFAASHEFDVSVGSAPNGLTTSSVWLLRSTTNFAPSGLVCAIYLRPEAERISDGDGAGLGIAQASFAAVDVTEGSGGLPTMAFGARVKGLSRVGQTEVSRDAVRLIVGAPLGDFYGVFTIAANKAHILMEGYEIKPT